MVPLKMIEQSGTWTYSNIITIQVTDASANTVYPTVINNGVLSIKLDGSFSQ